MDERLRKMLNEHSTLFVRYAVAKYAPIEQWQKEAVPLRWRFNDYCLTDEEFRVYVTMTTGNTGQLRGPDIKHVQALLQQGLVVAESTTYSTFTPNALGAKYLREGTPEMRVYWPIHNEGGQMKMKDALALVGEAARGVVVDVLKSLGATFESGTIDVSEVDPEKVGEAYGALLHFSRNMGVVDAIHEYGRPGQRVTPAGIGGLQVVRAWYGVDVGPQPLSKQALWE